MFSMIEAQAMGQWKDSYELINFTIKEQAFEAVWPEKIAKSL